MSRLTGTDTVGLMEAYNAVYYPQELTEEQVWEEVEVWVNSLLEEGYDLSDYTWEEMYEEYLNEMGRPGGNVPGGGAAAQRQRNAAAQTQTALNQGRGIQVRDPNYRGPLAPTSTGYQATLGGRTGVLVPGTNAPVSTGRATSTPGVNRARPITVGGQTLYPAARGNDIMYLPGGSSSSAAPRPSAGGGGGGAAPRPSAGGGGGGGGGGAAPRPSAGGGGGGAPTTNKPVPTATTQKGPTGMPLVGGIERRTPTRAEMDAARAARESAKGDKTTPSSTPSSSTLKSTPSASTSSSSALKSTPSAPTAGREEMLQRNISKSRTPLASSYDLFDVIKGHLLDEGYADTEEAALAIMASMSEDWRESIIEAVGIVGPPQRAIDVIPGVRALRQWASDNAEAARREAQMRSPNYDPRAGQTTRSAKPRPGTRDPGRPIDPRSYYNPRNEDLRRMQSR